MTTGEMHLPRETRPCGGSVVVVGTYLSLAPGVQTRFGEHICGVRRLEGL